MLGTISDSQIKKICDEGKLITKNFSNDNIEQACYELRAGFTYFDLSSSSKRYDLNEGDYILLKPKQIVSIITYEELTLDTKTLGRILTKGSFFSLGIIAVNTYADPGFKGNLGIVFQNFSNNYLKIKPKESIAKIEFSILEENVSEQYSGQHGFRTDIWPIKSSMILTEKEITNDYRVEKTEIEIEKSYGEDIGRVVKRVFSFERKLILSAITYFILTSILIFVLLVSDKSTNSIVAPIISIILGITSNLIFAFIVHFATNLKKG